MRLFWLALLIVSAALAADTPVETHHYLDTTGKDEKRITWKLEKRAQTNVLHYSAPTEEHVTITGPDFGTRSWSVSDTEVDSDFTAERNGAQIHIRGRFKGEPVDKTLTIDEAPWYQATSLSLRSLIAADDGERVFWTIRADTLTVHKIRAIKKGVETRGHGEPLLHIRLTLTGLLAAVWKSDYWFSLPQGVFFRFEGPSGPPGAPKTIVQRQLPDAGVAD